MSNSAEYSLNHVAVSVPDCEAAVEWYTTTLGFKQIMPNALMSRQTHPDLAIFQIYGSDLHEAKVAFLGMGNDVGLEIFEFIKPKYHGSKNLFDKESWTRGGYFHIAITAVDPAQLATSIVEKGGKQVGPLCSLPNGQKAVYVKDPWGNVVEIASCDFAKLVSP